MKFEAFLTILLLILLPSLKSHEHLEENHPLTDITAHNITIDELDIDTNDSLTDRNNHQHKKHDCPFIHGDFPIFLTDKEDPSKYFQCQHGASILLECPAQLKFDSHVRGCVWFLASVPIISTPPPCGCGEPHPTSPPTTPCPHSKPVPTTTTQAPCGCGSSHPTSVPCPHSKPTTQPPCVHTKPTAAPTPSPCGCKKKPPTATPTSPPCGCTKKPPTGTPKPTPKPCNHAPDPCGCSNPIPDPYTTKKPSKAPGPRPTPVAAIPKCPFDQSNNAVFIPHPTDSSKFYQCSWGTAFECKCSEGLIFHIGLQACGWPQAGPSQVIVADFDCFADDDKAVLLPHSTDGHKFYKIYQGSAYECCCPMSEIFKSDARKCVNFEVPVCPDDLGSNVIYLSHPDHRLFYECASGKVNLFYCSTGTFFHPDKKSCIAAKINI